MTAGVMQGKLSKLTELKGIGPALEAQLGKLGIHTLTDLCFHLPFRYEDRSRVIAIGALRPMAPAVIEGQVTGTKVVFGRRRSMVVTLRDDSGQISLRFYHFSNAQKNQFSNGTRVRCYGEPRRGVTGLEMYHPEYQLPDLGQDLPTEEALTPVYPATEGVTQQRLRLLTTQLLDLLRDDKVDLPDLLPDVWCREWRLPGLRESLLFLHQPPPDTDLFALSEGHHPAQTRLILEELLAHQLSLFKLRSQVKADEAPAVVSDHRLRQQLLAALPFTPTTAQQRVTAEITEDIRQPHPMLRLVQGDVGSGKTLVAALAACDLLQAGYQVALMAPTEILARQHFASISSLAERIGVSTVLLTGRERGKTKESAIENLREGIIITDEDAAIVRINQAVADITGYKKDELLGQNPNILSSNTQPNEFYESMWQQLDDKGYWQGEIWNRRKDGEFFAESLTITAVKDESAQVRNYVSVFSDVTQQAKQRQHLEKAAFFDTLTGLPNRMLLADRLAQAIELAKRNNNLVACVFIDLDKFKPVNDSYGHQAGDHLLVTLAARMSTILRKQDTLARIGGDEFVAVIGNLTEQEACLTLIERLNAEILNPVKYQDDMLCVSASIGISFYDPMHDISAETLQKQADKAMYKAKELGRNGYQIFTDSMMEN